MIKSTKPNTRKPRPLACSADLCLVLQPGLAHRAHLHARGQRALCICCVTAAGRQAEGLRWTSRWTLTLTGQGLALHAGEGRWESRRALVKGVRARAARRRAAHVTPKHSACDAKAEGKGRRERVECVEEVGHGGAVPWMSVDLGVIGPRGQRSALARGSSSLHSPAPPHAAAPH